jgi:predicted AAA+ superfamily ATPase
MQSAWSGNVAKRVIKAPKSYLVDTGLLSWLRMLNMNKLLQEVVSEKGHVVENFVVNEIQKHMTWSATRCSMYHFRSASNVEVDIVLERMDGKIVGIEIKSSQNVSSKDAQGLLSLKNALPENKWHRGVVLYGGDVIVPLADGIIALPLSALWAKK